MIKVNAASPNHGRKDQAPPDPQVMPKHGPGNPPSSAETPQARATSAGASRDFEELPVKRSAAPAPNAPPPAVNPKPSERFVPTEASASAVPRGPVPPSTAPAASSAPVAPPFDANASVPKVHRLSATDLKPLLDRAQEVPAETLARVQAIWDDVHGRGDAALREWTLKLDGADLADPFVNEVAWSSAIRGVPDRLREALDANLVRVKAFHERQRRAGDRFETAGGVLVGRRPVPFDAVACYVPGGTASYPSTVLMTVVPAAIAGVPRIIVVTPPRADGSVDPLVLYAAKAAGAHQVLRAGGAQAIAAVANGTAKVPRVQAIVGPGNHYVTAAKQLAARRCWTDAPAGPSELLVVADASAPPAAVALDLLAQAEHDVDAQVVLATPSAALAEAVRAELVRRLPAAARRDIIATSLARHAALLVTKDLDEAIAFANAYAPEHLTLMVQDPEACLGKVRNAGSVFMGAMSPVALGDYGSGTNHVLPTMGHAATRGGLSVDDFRKWISWQSVTPSGLKRIGLDVAAVARAEGLVAHAESVEERLGLPKP